MVSLGRKYCIFGCADLGAHMHSFPHYIRRPEMFQKWVEVVGSKLTETNPMKIFKNKRVCDYHFTSDQKVACHRLMNSAEPSVNLEGIFMTPAISIRLEHNYSIPGVHNIHPSCEKNTSDAYNSLLLDSTDSIGVPIETDNITTHVTSLKNAVTVTETAVQNEIRRLRAQLRKRKKCESIHKPNLETMKIISNTNAFATRKRTSAKRVSRVQFQRSLKKLKGRQYKLKEIQSG